MQPPNLMSKTHKELFDIIVGLYSRQLHDEALQGAELLLKQYPLYANTQNILSAIYSELGEFCRAWEHCKKGLILSPDAKENYNTTASILAKKNQLNAAVLFHNRALTLSPNYKQSLYNLGTILQSLGKFDQAITCYKSALKLDSNYQLARYFLGLALSEQGDHQKSALIFENLDFKDSKTRLVEELYFTASQQRFISEYKKLLQLGVSNSIIGALGCHAQVKFKQNLPNTFCNDPFRFIRHYKFVQSGKEQANLVTEVRRYLALPSTELRNQPLVSNGWQTAGNLFLGTEPFVIDIKKRILTAVSEYRNIFGKSNEGFIKNWPNNFHLKGWIIGMTTGGFLDAHIHKDSWISGSVYLSVPNKNNNNDGNLVLSIDGGDYPKEGEKFPETVIEVRTGDICIFPSSLFHYTTPIHTSEERLVLAFDIKIE